MIHQETPFCDFCNTTKAILYCRADSAKLCFSCDNNVHSTNPLFKKHSRSLLCNACDDAPASIYCCTDSYVFCQNCDWESHKGFGGAVHARRPVDAFVGCPSVSEFVGLFGFQDLGVKKNGFDEKAEKEKEEEDFLVWETNTVVGFEDLVVPTESHGFQVMGVPPLPKNRNAVCGKHKDEILAQLREMVKTEPDFSGSLKDIEQSFNFQAEEPSIPQMRVTSPGFKLEQESVPTYEINTHQWCDYTDEGFSPGFLGTFVDMNDIVPDKDFGDGSVVAGGALENQSFDPLEMKPVIPKAVTREVNSQERDSALSRYKEKKKTRRYDKHIRYESRKVRAETRIRIKGRFAKMDC